IRVLLGLHAVLRARLLAVGHAGGVERPAHHLVAHARQVLDAAAAAEHDGVLLQVVTLARDVARDLHAVGEPHAGDLPQSRVRLLGRGRVNARADAAALRGREHLLAALARLETRRRELLLGLLAALANELIDARHAAQDASSARAARTGPDLVSISAQIRPSGRARERRGPSLCRIAGSKGSTSGPDALGRD